MSNPLDPGYWREDDLRSFGFTVGRNVMVARNCTIIGLKNQSFENITIGDNVRIDGMTTIAAAGGYLRLGSYIHIGGYCFLNCGAGVALESFTTLSQGVRVYSTSDDYSGEFMTNPMTPAEYTNVRKAAVTLSRHVIVGSGSTILPGTSLGEGVAVGAMSLVNRSLEPWGIYGGIPARLLRPRSKALLEAQARLLSGQQN